jgi:hypothetical protein
MSDTVCLIGYRLIYFTNFVPQMMTIPHYVWLVQVIDRATNQVVLTHRNKHQHIIKIYSVGYTLPSCCPLLWKTAINCGQVTYFWPIRIGLIFEAKGWEETRARKVMPWKILGTPSEPELEVPESTMGVLRDARGFLLWPLAPVG